MTAPIRIGAAIALLVPFSGCASPPDSPATTPLPGSPTIERMLPSDYVLVDDERPFEWRQADYLRDTLETEIAALTLEVELERASASGPGPRAQRATQDRAALATLMMAARPRPDRGADFSSHLPPIDRFVHDYVAETLRRQAYTPAKVEAWRGSNRRFLASRDLAVRDAALAARSVAFQDLASAMPLRQLLADLSGDPLDDAARAQAYGKLKLAYPDAPLPTAGFDTAVAQVPRSSPPADAAAAPSASGKTAGAAPGIQPGGLPRLDGAEVALREIPDLRALLTGASAGAPQR